MQKDRFKQLERAAALPEKETAPEDNVFVTFPELKKHGIPWSRVHIRNLIDAGLFVRPVQISANRIAWRLSELRAWKASRPRAPLPTTRASAKAA